MSTPSMQPPEAAGPSESVEPTPRRRLLRALLRPSRGQVVVSVLLAVLGVAAVTQVRVAGHDDTYAGMRQPELIQVLNGLNAAERRSEREIDDLAKTRDSLQSTSARREAALKQARKQLTALGILAGTLPAQGPGIEITVDDPEDKLTVNMLLDGIEELRDAGAEAMEINHTVRVVAQTSFEDGTGGVVVDGTLLSAPYVITAIGDPETLAKAIGILGGFADDAQEVGQVTVRKKDLVEITVLRNPVKPSYALPVRGE